MTISPSRLFVATILALVCVCLTAEAQQQTNFVTLTWNDTGNPGAPTNYIYLIRGTNNVAAPLPWPILTNAVGVLTQRVCFTQLPGNAWLFYVTATAPGSSTNNVRESLPSNNCWDTLLFSIGPMTISK